MSPSSDYLKIFPVSCFCLFAFYFCLFIFILLGFLKLTQSVVLCFSVFEIFKQFL